MSAAINQVVQSLHAHLMRIDSVGLAILSTAIPPLARGAHQQQSRSNSWWRPLVATLPTHPPVAAFSTHLATPRAISTPIRCRQCPPQVIEDQWARSPTPWFFHSATAVHSRKNSSASRPGVRAGNKVVHTYYLLYKLTHRQRRDPHRCI